MAFALYFAHRIKAKWEIRYILHPPLFPLLQYINCSTDKQKHRADRFDDMLAKCPNNSRKIKHIGNELKGSMCLQREQLKFADQEVNMVRIAYEVKFGRLIIALYLVYQHTCR